LRIAVVSVPYGHDVARWGYAKGPEAFLQRGLVASLTAGGHDVAPPVAAVLKPPQRTRDTVTNLGRLGGSVADLVEPALRDPDTFVLALTGNCMHASGVAGGVARARGGVGLVWIDAHGDLHTQATSETGFWGGMPLAVILGWDFPDWRLAAGLETPVASRAVALLGTSDLDAAEAIRRHDLAHLDARQLTPTRIRDLLVTRRQEAPAWYLHIDLDVAGPEAPGVITPAPYWPSRATLLQTVAEVARAVPLGALALSSINPLGDPEGKAARLGVELAEAVVSAAAAAGSSPR
jgi:arginase